LLARAGIASRREIERMIEARRIAIDGKPIETPATIVTSLHGVTVDGKPSTRLPPPACSAVPQAVGPADDRARSQGPPDHL
jgi:23S rRNA pseudouridine2605 synthase